MESLKKNSLIELLNIILKESSINIKAFKDLSDESKVKQIIHIM
jgi:hypothetical protein